MSVSASWLLVVGLAQGGVAEADEPVTREAELHTTSRRGRAREVPADGARAVEGGDRVGVVFGDGIQLRSADDRFALTLRGRVQLRGYVVSPGVAGDPVDLAFRVRRARLVLQGHVFDRDLQFYVQLGLAPLDMEPDLMVPIRDAAITWTGLRDLHVRFGQMKVPFNRERVISSSALQLVDRSIVNAELNLDRDVGLQLFSNDLFGLGGRLRYQLGVFGGEGRNRWGAGPGLLYVGRVEVQPLGGFEDSYVESDLSRDARPRLALGGAFAFNHESVRARSTHGDLLERTRWDTLHAQADLIFKVRGFSLLGEFLWRRTTTASVDAVDPEAPVTGDSGPEPSRSGLGWMVQAGYLFPQAVEPSLRFAEIRPIDGVLTELSLKREATAGLSWYVKGHDLKLQADYAFTFADDLAVLTHTGRVQTQIFF